MKNVLETDPSEGSNGMSPSVLSPIDIFDNISLILLKEIPTASPELKIVVIIPAKNEGSDIEETLRAHLNQCTKQDTFFPKAAYEVIVLCHNCTDNTFEKSQNFKNAHPETRIHILKLNSEIATNVGAARRILMNIACSRLPSLNGLIASTDADTTPNKFWLYNLEGYIKTEVDLICGLINVDYTTITGQPMAYLRAKNNYMMLQAQLESTLLPNQKNPWPRHNYNWGPNLIIKKHVYLSVGGINPLSFLEDVDLFNRVVEKGYVVRHCMNTIVTTSIRIKSRCDEGFGAELRVWTENEGIPYCVEGLNKLNSRFQIYRLIQSYYTNPSQETLKKISANSHIKKKELAVLLTKYLRYEAMMIYMKQHLSSCSSWNCKYPNIPVSEACKELTTHLHATNHR